MVWLITKQSLPFTEELIILKNLVEQHSNENDNSCLLKVNHKLNCKKSISFLQGRKWL